MKKQLKPKKEKTPKKVKEKKSSIGYYGFQFRQARRFWGVANPFRNQFKKSNVKKDEHGFDLHLCNKCKDWFSWSNMQIDHVEPVGKAHPQSLEEYITAFIKLDSQNLQKLCKKCHASKTVEDVKKIKESKK